MLALIDLLPALLKLVPGLAELINHLVDDNSEDPVTVEVLGVLNDHFSQGVEDLDERAKK